MRRLLLLLFVAASAEAMGTCPTMVPDVNVYINFWGNVGGCTPASGMCAVGEPITFVAAPFAYNFDCAPHEFLWNFGDGVISTGRAAIHAYGSRGTFAVSLTIRNPAQSVTMSQIVVIDGSPPPAFLASPIYSGRKRVYGAFRFDVIGALGSGDWIWDFGDGAAARGPARTQEHVYAESGTYVVKLSSAGFPAVYTESVHVPEIPKPRRRRSARH